MITSSHMNIAEARAIGNTVLGGNRTGAIIANRIPIARSPLGRVRKPERRPELGEAERLADKGHSFPGRSPTSVQLEHDGGKRVACLHAALREDLSEPSSAAEVVLLTEWAVGC